jgi:hypothetical protein
VSFPSKEATTARRSNLVDEAHKTLGIPAKTDWEETFTIAYPEETAERLHQDHPDFDTERWLRQMEACTVLIELHWVLEVMDKDARLADRYRAKLRKLLEVQQRYF